MNTIRDKVENLIKEVSNAAQTRAIYGGGHGLTQNVIDGLYANLNEILSDREEITIGVIGNEVAFEKEPFYEASKQLNAFISHLKSMEIEKITLRKGIERKEIANFIDAFVVNAKELKEAGGLEKLLESHDVQNIMVGKIDFSKETLDKNDINTLAKKNFHDGIDLLTKISQNIKNNQPIDVKIARLFISNIISTLLKDRSSLLLLTSLMCHDEYTFVHAINVAVFTLVQAESLNLNQNLLNEIGTAALFHDIGKLALGKDILNKETGLKEEETEEIHKHPTTGAKILLSTQGINPLISIVSFEHHIKNDMTGYPQKLYGGNLNLVSKMVSISDYYDAVRSERSYHKGIKPEEAFEAMMKLSGIQFHPELLNNFFNIIGVYPPGTLVELTDGTIGIVIRENALDIKRPQVEILYNAKGQKEGQPQLINLLEQVEKTREYKRNIVKSITPSEDFELPEKYKLKNPPAI